MLRPIQQEITVATSLEISSDTILVVLYKNWVSVEDRSHEYVLIEDVSHRWTTAVLSNELVTRVVHVELVIDMACTL